MDQYRGWAAGRAPRPRIPGDGPVAVVYVTPGAVEGFLAAHPASRTIFLLEFRIPGNTFPPSRHLQSLQTLRQFGYCPFSNTGYPIPRHLTTLKKSYTHLRGPPASTR